jgi:hypothetical protein
MKTLALMITAGGLYAFAVEKLSEVINNSPLNGDTRLSLYLIGMTVGVITARKLEWID